MTAAIVGARAPWHVDDWLPASDLELDTATLTEVDLALAETGAGSDDPPTPPPHIRPPVSEEVTSR